MQIYISNYLFLQYPKTCIPCGEKIPLESTHQVSFRNLPSISATFDRDQALSNLQKTTFRNGDNKLNGFRTTTNECYSYTQPVVGRRAEIVIVSFQRSSYYI